MEISFLFKSFITLFTIIDPIAGAPFFLSITAGYPEKERQKIALKASLTALITLLIFFWLGRYVLALFQISLSSFRIAGGTLLFITALEMLFGKTTQVKTSEKEATQVKELEDPSVVPLGIPYLAGPGAITTAIILGESPEFSVKLALSGTIFLVILITYFILSASTKIFKHLGELGTKAVVRILGLILASIAIEYIITGLKENF
ncbi:MarC family protein [Thermodesulfobacterium sp. TA1]|uniref:MarC family protein n=1 Tax=Thermodesulfobacterium sp. TA1 TaxID=2234087 RepID=UPI001231E1DD|nr:MarC family protein [Thermodesulfobacterium sp. TA1]QER42044.1 MarC family protein [Thermodesulfobacterium sp. TA1]